MRHSLALGESEGDTVPSLGDLRGIALHLAGGVGRVLRRRVLNFRVSPWQLVARKRPLGQSL